MASSPQEAFYGNYVTVSYSEGNSVYTLATQSPTSAILVGSFPNDLNSNLISNTPLTYTLPFRGGKNFKAKTPSQNQTGIIGLTSIGIEIASYVSRFTHNYNTLIWTLNDVAINFDGIDEYGGYVDSLGIYRYVNAKFLKTPSWFGFFQYRNGWRQRSANLNDPLGHSLIIGWSLDGYPIYGPWGYSDPMDVASGIKLLKPGYKISPPQGRPPGVTVFVNGDFSVKETILLYSSRGVGVGMQVTGQGVPDNTIVTSVVNQTITLTRPITITRGKFINCSYPPGFLLADYVYDASLKPDLDEFNGRYCITPDYPEGTYAYFAAVDDDENPVFPYFVGSRYYGKITADNTVTTLQSLTLAAGTISPSFTPNNRNYDIFIANTSTSVTLTPSVSTDTSKIYLFQTRSTNLLTNNRPYTYTGIEENIPETFSIIVASEYETTGNYNLNVTRLPSNNNLLSVIRTNAGNFSPAFNPNIDQYNLTVSNLFTIVDIYLESFDSRSTIQVNGIDHLSGTFRSYSTKEGFNEFNIVVTSQSGVPKTYNFDVIRLNNDAFLNGLSVEPSVLNPSFDKNQFYYTHFIPFTTSSFRVTPVTEDNSTTIYVNNLLTTSSQTQVISGLNVGWNITSIRTVSNNPIIEYLYRIATFRERNPDANLTDLTLTTGTLVPSFDSSTYVYSVSVPFTVSSIGITPTAASTLTNIYVGTDYVPSGTLSPTINLSTGLNQLSIFTLAGNNVSSATYTVNLTRIRSTDSSLTNLEVVGFPISPAFNSNTFNYISTVSNWKSHVYLIPTSRQPDAEIYVNNQPVLSGKTSQQLTLLVGTNTATVRVVSPDQSNTSTYNLNLRRLPTDFSALKNLFVSKDPYKVYQISRATTTEEIAVLLLNGFNYLREDIYIKNRV